MLLNLGGSSKIEEEVGTKTTRVEVVFYHFEVGSISTTLEKESLVTTRFLRLS